MVLCNKCSEPRSAARRRKWQRFSRIWGPFVRLVGYGSPKGPSQEEYYILRYSCPHCGRECETDDHLGSFDLAKGEMDYPDACAACLDAGVNWCATCQVVRSPSENYLGCQCD